MVLEAKRQHLRVSRRALCGGAAAAAAAAACCSLLNAPPLPYPPNPHPNHAPTHPPAPEHTHKNASQHDFVVAPKLFALSAHAAMPTRQHLRIRIQGVSSSRPLLCAQPGTSAALTCFAFAIERGRPLLGGSCVISQGGQSPLQSEEVCATAYLGGAPRWAVVPLRACRRRRRRAKCRRRRAAVAAEKTEAGVASSSPSSSASSSPFG